MTTKKWRLWTMLGVLALAPPRVLAAQEVERIRGSEVAVYNLAGRAEIVRGEGADVVVRVSRGGNDAGRLRVETGEVRGRQTLRVVYPGDEIVYPEFGGSRKNLIVADDGTFPEGGSALLALLGWGGDRVTIRGSGDGIEAWADLVIEVPVGQRAAVYLGAGAIEARGVDGRLDIDMGPGSVTATAMAGALAIDTSAGTVRVSGMGGNLSVDTGSGSIDVENLTAGAKVELDTGSGGIDVKNVTGSGEVELDTGSGGVSARAVQARRLIVDTGSGSVKLKGVASPDITVDTGSGSVELELLTDVDALKVDTGSGSVTVSVPPDLGATMEIDTGSGGIEPDIPVKVGSVSRDHLRGLIGDGRGRIVIDTGSGSVHLVGN